MLALTVNELSMAFGAKEIFNKISFALQENDKLGIIGTNGCGKSTLFKIILGEHRATEGNVFIAKNKSIGILTQDCAFEVSELCGKSALEQMYSAYPELLSMEKKLALLEEKMTGAQDTDEHLKLSGEYSDLYTKYAESGGLDYRSRCASTLISLGFDEGALSLPIDKLSGGQRTRLALARQLCREPDILLLDEPTNHLDASTVSVLEDYLKGYKKCVMIISHDRYFLDKVTNKTLAIEHKSAKMYNGNYTASIKQREVDREIAERHYINQQREIARQEAYIAQQRAWNRERNIIAAESRQKLLDKMERVERPKEAPRPVVMKFKQALPSGNEVLRAVGLSKSYGEKKLFSDVDFLVRRGERVFLIGKNGCGKSTLLKILVGELEASAGYIEAGYNVEIGYYDQENHNLTEENTVLDELWNAYPDKKEFEIRSALALFRFYAEDCEKRVSMLSGGERARLTLAKLIMSPMNLLVLDEPTNHLDIPSREALESALDEFSGTVLVVSHDRYLVNKLATRIFEIDGDSSFEGGFIDYPVSRTGDGYSEYTEFKRRRAPVTEQVKEVKATSTQKEEYLLRKKENADARREQKRLERLRAEAEKLEALLEELEAELYGEAATDYKKAAELDAKKQEAETRLLEIYGELE